MPIVHTEGQMTLLVWYWISHIKMSWVAFAPQMMIYLRVSIDQPGSVTSVKCIGSSFCTVCREDSSRATGLRDGYHCIPWSWFHHWFVYIVWLKKGTLIGRETWLYVRSNKPRNSTTWGMRLITQQVSTTLRNACIVLLDWTACALTCAVWDHVLTINDEITYIWVSKKLGFTRVSYMFNRYGIEIALMVFVHCEYSISITVHRNIQSATGMHSTTASDDSEIVCDAVLLT